jgi:hypothetical protein
MHEFQHRLGGASRGELFPHVILNGFDIVVGASLDLLDCCCGVCIRFVRKLPRAREHFGTESGAGKPRDRCGQVHQPVRLDPNALPDEAGLRENAPQGLGGRTIASIDR